MKKEFEFPHLSNYLKRCSKQLQLTRDEIVRSTLMGSKHASAVWNGKDIRLSYYIQVLKLLLERSKHPRFKMTEKQLLEGLIEALQQELENIWNH